MSEKGLSFFIRALFIVAEQNISDIEKIHMSVRNRRFLGKNIILLVGLIIIVGYTFLTIKYQKNSPLIMAFLPMLIIMPISIRSEKKGNLLKYSSFFLLTVFLEVFFAVSLVNFLINSLEESKYAVVVLVVLICLLMLLFAYSMFVASKNLAESLVGSLFNKAYYLKIKLLSGEMISGRLNTITKKGDYIIYSNELDSEIMIRTAAISTLEIKLNV